MQLSIILPAYNESKVIAASLQRVLEFCRRELSEWEVIVVDDGSTDGTADIVSSIDDVRCIRNEVNRGKGRSVKRGIQEANFDTILFTDVDLATPIDEALALFAAVRDGADVAIASRRTDANKTVHRTPLRKLMAFVFGCIVKLVAVRGIHDTQCGFKMFRKLVAREVIALQRLDGWAFDVEVLFLVQRLGYRIVEVPVAWQESAESSLSFLSPFAMVIDLLRIRVNQWTGKYAPARGGGRKERE